MKKTAAGGSGKGSSSRGAAAAATGDRGGGSYPLMAPLVASWFKKGAAAGKAPVAASAAATLLVRADGEVDVELSMDGPGGAAAASSSLLELVAGRGKGKKGRGVATATAGIPSPVEAAKAARRLFLSLVTTALVPVAQAASGALRSLAALLQQVAAALSGAAKGAAVHSGVAARRAVQGPLALVAGAGRAVEALLTESLEGEGGVRGYAFPQDTAAFLGDVGKRVGASVLRAAAETAGHVGRAGHHVKFVSTYYLCVGVVGVCVVGLL